MGINTLTKIKKDTKPHIEYITVRQKYETTPHILTASSSLMGICFIVLTSIKLVGKADQTIIDEITGIAIIVFMASCIFSFLSIRLVSKRKWLESAADIIFLAGLFLLFITTMLFSFNIIK